MDHVRQDTADALRMPTSLALDAQHEPVYESRRGNVLVPFSILKCDYFVGSQNTTLRPRLAGAPNYRFVDTFGVVGTAVPTSMGVQNVLLRVADLSSSVKWVNLREEPLLYINSRPYCLRDVESPYVNLEKYWNHHTSCRSDGTPTQSRSIG